MNKLGELKKLKHDLINQKNEITEKKASKFLKTLYVLGIFATAISSSITFWKTTPSLIFCFTYLYTVMVPLSYSRIKEFKISKIYFQLLEIQREIDECEKVGINKVIQKNELDSCKEFKQKQYNENRVLSDNYDEYCNNEMNFEDGMKLLLTRKF